MSSTALWYATRATGIVALWLLSGSVLLGLLTATRFSTRNWPGFAQQELHKKISLIAVVLVAVHVLTSVADTYVKVGWAAAVVPFASHYKTLWVAVGTVSVDLLVAVVISSLLRHRINARLWRGIHWLAYVSWPVAMAHAFGMGTDMGQAWVIATAAFCVTAVLVVVTWRVQWQLRARHNARLAASSPVVLRHLPADQGR